MARRKNMKVVSIFILAIFVFTLVCPIAAFAEETMENIAYKKPATCSDPPDIASKTHTPELAVDGIGNEYGNGCSLESSLIMEGAWLQIDLEGEYVIKRIEMDDRVGDDWDGPRKNFVFRASNDPNFETYVNLCEPVTEEFENDTTWSCEVTDPNGYRYIRFVKLVQSYQFIPEIRVFGVPSGSGQEPEPEPEDEIAFYVSSDGNDSNDGSIDSPFLTIERARDAVRQINSDMDKDITVYLRGGEYKIEDTIEFNSTDSGTNGYYITYRNYPGETPVLSGGESIDGWVQEGSLFKTNIGAGTKIRELFVNGQRAQRARSQSFKIRAWNSGEKLFAIDKDAVAEWAEVDPNMEVVILQHWVLNYFKLGSYSTDGDYVWIGVNGKGNKVKDFYSDPYPAKDVDTSVHFENSLMYLDRPGEWCLVESTGDVYYYPREGETLQNLKAVTPGIETIMKLTGTSTNNRIKNIRIQGISFEYTKWQEYIDEDGVIPQQADMTEYRTVNRPPAVIFIDCAENLKIERNVIRHTANAGIDIYTKSINNEITGNVLLDIGSNGIQEGLFNESGARTLTVQGNKIRNNYLKGISVTSSGCGIVCGYTNGVVIEHNEISDCAYTGISVGWGWTNNSTALGNNKINYNHIYNVVNKLSDGGAIYTLSRAPGSEIIGNYIHDIDRSEWCSRSAAATIYLDQESRGFRVADNVFRRVGQTLNGSTVIDPENTVENNDSQDQDIIDNAGLEPEYMDIVPGIISHKSGADWISPERCSVIISGNVALKEEGSSLEVSILKNGEEIWSGTVDSTSGISYHKNIDVEEGDVISFKAMNGDTPADGLVSWDSLISIQEYPPLLTMEISFSPDQLGEAGEVLEYKTDYYSKRITIRVGEDVDVKNLVPTIVTPPGTVVEPASGVARDFSDIVKYTVWMEEGSKYTDFDGSRKFKVWDVAVIKEQSATVVRGYNINDVISDEDNWEVTGGTKTATDNSITFTEGIATYTGRTFLNELLEFNLNISSGGWPSIVFRMKNHDTIYNPGNEGYIICIKEDQIELQRFNDGERTVFYGNIGESPSKYGDSVPNNEGLFAYGKDHHVQVGAMNVDDGVRLLMYIDGKKVFDCIDNFEGYITEPGYFGTHQLSENASMKLSKVPVVFSLNDVISDVGNWEVTGGTKAATDYSIAFTEGIATYTGRTFLDELLEFNLNISSGGWPSIVFRMKNHDTIYNPGNEGYIICIKEDQIELQRFNDGERTVFYGNIGESPSKYGDSVPNNEGLFAYGKDHHVQVGAMNVDDGVRLLMYIDGKKVFDCIDNFEGYITEPGYFGTHQLSENATITLSKVPDVFSLNDVISDVDNWEVTGGTKTATDYSIAFTEGIATYTGRTFLDELLEFNLNISSGGWPSVVFRMKNHDTIYNPGNEGYIICIKEDQIELQRFNDGERTVFYGNIGESPSKYGDSVPNNEGLFAYGRDHLVQVGAVNVDDGVRLLMYIDGKKVFDCIDNFEGYITEPGYFGTHQLSENATIKLSKNYISSAGAEPASNREFLGKEITKANNLLEEAVIGEEEGQYPLWAKEYLLDAIAEAQVIYGDENLTEDDYREATNALKEAQNVFKKAKIVLFTNVALNKPVTSSEGEHVLPGHEPFRAVNGMVGPSDGWSAESGAANSSIEYWQLNPNVEPWLTIDLGSPTQIYRVEVVDRPGTQYDGERKNFEIQASNDPSFEDGTYVVLGSVGEEPFENDSTWVLEVTDTAKYRYVRYAKTEISYAYVSEIRVFGEAEPQVFTVGGTVKDASQKPVAGATVNIYSAYDPDTVLGTAVTAADGSYTIDTEQVAGKYIIKAEKSGVGEGNITMYIPFENVSNANIALSGSGVPDEKFTIGTPVFKDGNGNILEHLVSSTDLHASMEITNNSSKSESACFIVALYGPDQSFVTYASFEGTVDACETTRFSTFFKLPDNITGHYVKVFVWNSFEGMVPISNAIVFQ